MAGESVVISLLSRAGQALPYLATGFLGYELGTGKVEKATNDILPAFNNILFYAIIIIVLYMVLKGKV